MERTRTSISKFHLGRLIHEGARCEVFEARYTQAGGVLQPAVLKILRPEFACIGVELRSFLSEISWARSLRHPLFPRVLEAGEHGGEYFLAMERVDGSTLADLVRNLGVVDSPLPVSIGLAIAEQLARGIGMLHEMRGESTPCGLVHLGVSPSNIMIARSGRVVLLDFGSCSAQGTQAGEQAKIGREAFCAPEVMDSRAVDGRSDVFSLGRVMASMIMRMDSSDIDARMLAVIRRACRDTPEERFEGMAPFSLALEDLAASPPANSSVSLCHAFLSEVFGATKLTCDPRASRPQMRAAPLTMSSEGLDTVFLTPDQQTTEETAVETANSPEEGAFDDAEDTEPDATSSSRFPAKEQVVTALATPDAMRRQEEQPDPSSETDSSSSSSSSSSSLSPISHSRGSKKWPEELVATATYGEDPEALAALAAERKRHS